MLGVNGHRSLWRARSMATKNDMTWRNFQNEPRGSQRTISDEWRVYRWPEIVVLDKNRKVRYRGSMPSHAARVVRLMFGRLQ